MNMRKQVLLNAVVAGIVGFGLAANGHADEKAASAPAAGKDIECKGGNSCKGKGDCGGPGYSCSGNNGCRGKGFVNVKSQEECDKLIAKVKASGKTKGKSDKTKVKAEKNHG